MLWKQYMIGPYQAAVPERQRRATTSKDSTRRRSLTATSLQTLKQTSCTWLLTSCFEAVAKIKDFAIISCHEVLFPATR